MRQVRTEEGAWARNEFGQAKLGDSRRVDRVVRMAARAATAPSGRVSEVFTDDAERQGAYDLLETGQVSASELCAALALCAMSRCPCDERMFVAIDGSSLTLADRTKTKGFGSIGPLAHDSRGLKMVNALGVSRSGVPLGLCAQVWWSRTAAKSSSRKSKRNENLKRKPHEKEVRHWLQAIDESCERAEQTGTKLWFLLDREADSNTMLLKLEQSGHRFTVRGSWNRLVKEIGGDRQYLRQHLDREAAGGNYWLDVSPGPNRTARTAHIVVRWRRIVLRLRNNWTKAEKLLEVTAVWAREEGTAPVGEKPIDWMLLTNAKLSNFAEACDVIRGYTLRWRIEEFHRTWKRGACNVEQTQLRSQRAVIVWATILAAVSTRIERIKILSRSSPEQPARIELSRHEIAAVLFLKRDIKKRTETIPDTMPTIGQATLWIAQIGGYTGKSSGGPPGSITIGRGMERVRLVAKVFAAQAAGRAEQGGTTVTDTPDLSPENM